MKKIVCLLLVILTMGCQVVERPNVEELKESEKQNPTIDDEGFTSIFNGKNFDGWYIKLKKDDDPELKQKVFTVEDGFVHVFQGLPDGYGFGAS